jgi:hypothetical protein
MNCFRRVPVFMVFLFSLPALPGVFAQTDAPRFEVGAHFVSMQQRAFSTNDIGFGGRFTFYPITKLGVEFETSLFPKGLGKSVAFSGRRSEMLFGIKSGLRIGKFGFFGKVRPGFIRFSEASHPIACILIYPPPLECVIGAEGKTSFALDFGGIVETYPSRHFVIRADIGDTMIRFNGPAFIGQRGLINNSNVHNFRVNAGAGLRF